MELLGIFDECVCWNGSVGLDWFTSACNFNSRFVQLVFVVSVCCVCLFILLRVFIVFCGVQSYFPFLLCLCLLLNPSHQ